MVSEGDDAPEFTNKVANGDVEEFSLSEAVGDGPVLLAFFPGAFTPPCSNEMSALEEHAEEFEDAGASVYGLSADSPFSLNAFREEYDLSFPLVSDMGRETIRSYDLETDIGDLGLYGVANRAVYVVDDDGAVSYAWEADSPENEPDYEELLDAVQSA
ncbi:bacterioferritin comigrating protein [Halogeometricum pallidum JCM 14848]|uniref:Bacterioferritin comigrating protein n=1 Tax=Halogeometricum pallidum JCM 14848 TaxID=1227487 RepID=M0CV50_HALPD|nr:redoxin domain-containing protein [Halogeometricum pallidum]ELZ27090.1 bacterioferritin comigrating protein [Halogeometricum pallidum JCM 14848]